MPSDLLECSYRTAPAERANVREFRGLTDPFWYKQKGVGYDPF